MKNGRKPEMMKKTLSEKVRIVMMLHMKAMIGMVIAFLALLAVIVLWLSVSIDLHGQAEREGWLTYLYHEWEIIDALSLLVGYFGAGATIVLGLIAWKLSFEIEERKWVEQLQQIKIEQIRFYNMYASYEPSKLRHKDMQEAQYLIEIELSGISPHYQFVIEKMRWGGCGEDFEIKETRELNQNKLYIEDASNVRIAASFGEFEFMRKRNEKEGKLAEDPKNSISYFYHLKNYEPVLLDRESRCRWMCLDMCFYEKIWMKGQKPRRFLASFEILVENEIDKKQTDKYIVLHEIEHHFKILG